MRPSEISDPTVFIARPLFIDLNRAFRDLLHAIVLVIILAAGWSSLADAPALPIVIPYPQCLERTDGDPLMLGERGQIAVELPRHGTDGFLGESIKLIESRLAQGGLSNQADRVATRIELVIGTPEGQGVSRQNGPRTSAAEAAVLQRGSQAYVIRMTPGNPARIEIIGSAGLGVYYGATTLVQLFQVESGGRITVPCVRVQDYPDIPYRMSADWVLKYDWEVNGYDWGDGLESFINRCKRKIDLCSLYKVNMVRFLGGRMLPDTPGSAERFKRLERFALELNRYAAQRGVILQYSMSILGRHYYNWGNAYTEPWLESREYYPDGPRFDCIGKRVQNCASCPSNLAQRKIILEKIKQFIRKSEPRAIYLHHMDHFAESYAYIKEVWTQDRCAHCRQLFPDDEPMSPRGLAGAMAQYYSAVVRELKSVKNPESGYDASRDLMICFASPLYTLCSNQGSVYACFIFSKMILREQYNRWDEHGLRTDEMARALADAGWPNAVFMFAVQGGGFLPDHYLLVSSPVLTGIFHGATTLYNFNGQVHSEVQVLANVNYAWNNRAPGSIDPQGLPGRALEAAAQGYAGGAKHSDYLYGPFLETACERLYGGEAAPYLAQMYRLERDQGPLLPVLTAIEVIPPAGYDWAGQAKRNRQAASLVNQALRVCTEEAKADLAWLSRCLEAGARMSEFYDLAYGRRLPAPELDESGGRLREWLEQQFEFQITEPDGGDVGQWLGLITRALNSASRTR
ncbi:MAG: glycoside hydrolase family 20 zincin-like fold domain-containing protein [Candidatus Omnitrophica bacterium]|nr:glycoside hydrolase family 20 zincin-like fold domain-containing protein [Candidatus Omnitrophota bacterium]